MSLENKLTEIHGELEQFITRQGKQFTDLQKQVDAMDATMQKTRTWSSGGDSGDPVALMCRAISNGKADLERTGRLRFESKTLLSTGLVAPAAMPGIGASGRAAYGGVRASLRTVPITSGQVFKVRETVNGFGSSPQTEGSPKAESTTTLTGESLDVQTVASFINVSRQALGDVEGLAEFLRTSLVWANEAQVELQLISGDGLGVNLSGLTREAQAFDPTILSATGGYTYADVLAAAGVQLIESGFSPSHYVISPRDWFVLETLKDDNGNYILGKPREAFQAALWGKAVIPSPAMSTGTFLAYDASQSIIRQRMESVIDVSYEHASHFTSNLACIRCEERLLLVTMHGASVVTGSLVSSPA